MLQEPGYDVVPVARSPFDPFSVISWAPYIDQDDPRMISYDLRCELESAFDVHPFSPKCRQAVMKSLLLWATMSRAQRPCLPWNTENNLRLGQSLIQHLLDLTAESQGINTDTIYAALQAEQHPYLKLMHELQPARDGGRHGWDGRGAYASIAAARNSAVSHIASPTPQREPSAAVSVVAPTVLAESLARDELQAAEAVAVVEEATPEPLKTAPPSAPPPVAATPPPVITTPPPTALAARGKQTPVTSQPSTEKAPTVNRPAPPVPIPTPKGTQTAPHAPAGAPGKLLDCSLPPASQNTSAQMVTQPPVPPPRSGASKAVVAAPPTPPTPKTGTADDAASSKGRPREANGVTARAAPPALRAKTVDTSSPPTPTSPFVPSKPRYTYTDSDEMLSSHSDEVDEAAPPPLLTPPRDGTRVAVADVEAVRKFGDGGAADVLRALWNDLPADPDGVSAWSQRRLAVTEQDREHPLHADPTEAVALHKIKARMEPNVAKRLERLFQYLCANATAELPPHHEVAALMSAGDIAQLSAAGLIRPAKRVTGCDTVVAFTVLDVQEGSSGRCARRRFMSWPRGSNERAFQDGYEPHVPLHHISSYLNAVNAAAGCVESWANCFDQIPLPEEAQERFVFTDAENQRWCLTRLPMGHTVATEIVQILLFTLCGHPSYTLPAYAAPNGVRADVWVRAVRYYGQSTDVQRSRAMLRAACAECGVTLHGTERPADGAYDFIGVHFDHGTHRVSVAAEMLRRMEAPQQPVSTHKLERQYTQLLFCAAVLRVAASHYYKLLRAVSQRLLRAQEQPELLHTPTPLAADAFAQMERWHKAVSANSPRQVELVTLPNMTLFVELAPERWSAVLLGEETQETWNAEGSLEDMLGTKVACASITSAVECFQPCIDKGAHVSIRVLGGGAEGRNEKPIYKNESEEVIADCIRTHLVTRAFSFDVTYVDVTPVRGSPPISAGHKLSLKPKRK